MPIELTLDELMIIKDAFLCMWEEYRPEGDQTALYEKIVERIKEFNRVGH
jgi:hypothetical protein